MNTLISDLLISNICRLTTVLLTGIILQAATEADHPVDDRITAKLELARETYIKDVENPHKAVTDWFSRLEVVARKNGDQPLIDNISKQKSEFFDRGQQPKNMPLNLVRLYDAPRAKFETALAVAIRDYTKNGKDTESRAVLNELTELKRNRLVVLPITLGDSFPVNSKWSGKMTLPQAGNAQLPCRFSVTYRDGYKFSGLFEILGNADHKRRVHGLVSGNTISWQRKTTVSEQGHAGLDTTGVRFKETCSLTSGEGTAVMSLDAK